MGRFLQRQIETLWFNKPAGVFGRSLAALLHPLATLAGPRIERVQSQRRRQAPPLPLVVVGNLLAGGAGKTPVTLALALQLRDAGWRTGLLSSGYGSPAYRHKGRASVLGPRSPAAAVGDEAALLARRTGLPVASGGARRRALEALLEAHPGLQVVLSDDGLQHAALPRSIELCVLDARGFGNGRVLPAGPLREPVAGLARVDALILHELADSPELEQALRQALADQPGALAEVLAKPRFRMGHGPTRFMALRDWRKAGAALDPALGLDAAGLLALAAGRPIGALAATATPERFFNGLRQAGLEVRPHALPDHAPLGERQLRGVEEPFIVMTEKDAVKWPSGRAQRAYVAVRQPELDERLLPWLLQHWCGHDDDRLPTA